MNEEEKKALIALRVYGKNLSDEEFQNVTTTIKELMEKQNKENKDLKEKLNKADLDNAKLQQEIETLKNDTYWKGYIDKQNEAVEICKICKYKKQNNIKDKMINELIDELTCSEWDTCCGNCTHECEKDYDQLFNCIKEYFRKKVEDNG